MGRDLADARTPYLWLDADNVKFLSQIGS